MENARVMFQRPLRLRLTNATSNRRPHHRPIRPTTDYMASAAPTNLDHRVCKANARTVSRVDTHQRGILCDSARGESGQRRWWRAERSNGVAVRSQKGDKQKQSASNLNFHSATILDLTHTNIPRHIYILTLLGCRGAPPRDTTTSANTTVADVNRLSQAKGSEGVPRRNPGIFPEIRALALGSVIKLYGYICIYILNGYGRKSART